VSGADLERPRRCGSSAASARAAASPRSHRRLIEAFAARLAAQDPTGAALERADDVELLARQAADRVLDSSATWVEHLGAFYDTRGVRRLLARDESPISRQAVHKRRGLLSLTTGSGQAVYPAFQFSGRRPAPGLSEVLGLLPEELVSRWTVASWLVSPEAELDEQRPIDVLHDGGPEGAVAVRAVAARWAAQLGG
jgi:hypothetical protein